METSMQTRSELLGEAKNLALKLKGTGKKSAEAVARLLNIQETLGSSVEEFCKLTKSNLTNFYLWKNGCRAHGVESGTPWHELINLRQQPLVNQMNDHFARRQKSPEETPIPQKISEPEMSTSSPAVSDNWASEIKNKLKELSIPQIVFAESVKISSSRMSIILNNRQKPNAKEKEKINAAFADLINGILSKKERNIVQFPAVDVPVAIPVNSTTEFPTKIEIPVFEELPKQNMPPNTETTQTVPVSSTSLITNDSMIRLMENGDVALFQKVEVVKVGSPQYVTLMRELVTRANIPLI